MNDSVEQVSEIDRMRAFAQRMQAEGAAGFADGPEPWEHWQQPETNDNPAWDRHLDNSGKTEKTVCEKLMSGVASVSVLALALGIGGIWMTSGTSSPPLAGKQIQPEPIDSAIAQAGNALPEAIRRDTLPPQWQQAIDELPDTLAASEPLTGPSDLAAPATGLAGNPANTAPTPLAAPRDDMLAGLATTATPGGLPDALPAEPLDVLPAPAAGDTVIATATPADRATTQNAPTANAAGADPEPAAPEPATADGPWTVNISAYADKSLAQEKVEQFREKGVIAEIVPITVSGKSMHRIRVSGYDSKREAVTWVSLLEERLGIDGAWVSRK